MTLTRRQFGIAAGASAVAIASPLPLRAQSPIVIKYSHVVANDTPKGKGSLKFKELAEKYTGGKAKIEVYPNSSLYKDKEEIEALQLGAVQMLGPSTAKFAPLGAKEFEAMDLPFAFANARAYRKTFKGALSKILFDKLADKGVRERAFVSSCSCLLDANKPNMTPPGFKGLK